MTALHEQIRSDIEAQVLGGTLAPGDRLPVERELMARYGCSRMTVSKALSALAAAGIIERRRRAGSFVAAPTGHRMELELPDLAREVRARGEAYRYRLLDRRIAEDGGSAGGERLGGRVLVLEGVHHADDRPFAHETRVVSLAAVPAIDEARFDPEAPGSWLLTHVPWTEARSHVSAGAAGDRIGSLLGVDASTACLLLDRHTWRGAQDVTIVRQTFVGSAYGLNARFSANR